MKKSLRICALALTLTFIAAPAFADVKAGVDAWSRGDYPTAIKEWRPIAINGDADAQFNMGQAYKLGRGVPLDLKLAEDWYRKAAEQGHLQASDNYGLVLFQGGDRQKALPFINGNGYFRPGLADHFILVIVLAPPITAARSNQGQNE